MVLSIGSAHINLVLLLTLGFCVGVLGGFFGVGGGFIITPALNTLGAPIGFAIGTGLAQILGTSVIATLKHRKLGNVDFKLGIILVLSMVPAVEAGKALVLNLTKLGMAGDMVRNVYIVLLVAFGAQMLRDYFKKDKSSPATNKRRWFSFNLPPMISLNKSGVEKISLWMPVVLGLGTGILSGFVGVGGGFIMVPMLYMMGIPTATVVGTSLFVILLGSGTYGTFTYALSNEVSLGAALVMLAGASLGAQIGARATLYANVKRFRFLFSIILLLAGVSIIFKQVSTLHGWSFFGGYSTDLLMSAAVGMSLFITGFLLISSRKDRTAVGVANGVRNAIGLVRHLAEKIVRADLMNADAILESKDWPYLWRG
jgi:uncharacterized membrane protein YfcA